MSDREGPLEGEIRDEIEAAERPQRPIRRWFRERRAWAREHPRWRLLYLGLVALVGVGTSIVGLILVPLPGPGWLVVFLGLAILGTEFHWARRLTGWVKHQLNRFWTWWRARRQRRNSASGS